MQARQRTRAPHFYCFNGTTLAYALDAVMKSDDNISGCRFRKESRVTWLGFTSNKHRDAQYPELCSHRIEEVTCSLWARSSPLHTTEAVEHYQIGPTAASDGNQIRGDDFQRGFVRLL